MGLYIAQTTHRSPAIIFVLFKKSGLIFFFDDFRDFPENFVFRRKTGISRKEKLVFRKEKPVSRKELLCSVRYSHDKHITW